MSDEEGAYIAQELETFAMSEKSHAKKYIMLRAASFCREHSIINSDNADVTSSAKIINDRTRIAAALNTAVSRRMATSFGMC